MSKTNDTDAEIVRIATYWDPNRYRTDRVTALSACKDVAFLLDEIKRLREELADTRPEYGP